MSTNDVDLYLSVESLLDWNELQDLINEGWIREKEVMLFFSCALIPPSLLYKDISMHGVVITWTSTDVCQHAYHSCFLYPLLRAMILGLLLCYASSDILLIHNHDR